MSAQSNNAKSKVTVRSLQDKKRNGEKIVCLTAYDASFANLLDKSGVDVVLVGDSLGMVIQGLETTIPVTVEDMLYHSKAVAKGLTNSLLMVDMPFLSFTTIEEAIKNAGCFMQEAGAQMVKLEGGADQADVVSALAKQGIPVCAHLGLQPQKVHKIGGYRVQGRDSDAAALMLEEAQCLERAGADIMLLECVPETLAASITQALSIPVIGIGAGPSCDGQILVLYDILGISVGRIPKFSFNFLKDNTSVVAAIEAYVKAVKAGDFPSEDQVFK